MALVLEKSSGLEAGELDMRYVMTAEHVPIVRELEDYKAMERLRRRCDEIVQDPATAEVPYMPRFAREAVPEAEVLTLSAIPVRLRQLTQRAAKGDAA